MSKDLDIDNLEFSAPTVAPEDTLNHRGPGEWGKESLDFCGKRLAYKDRGACKNYKRPVNDPKGCGLCIRFSNFEEEESEDQTGHQS